MREPTIDEMLAWTDEAAVSDGTYDDKYRKAIRATLEQHRDSSIDAIRAVISEERGRDLLVIRAFVERVEKKMPQFLEGKLLTTARYVMRLERDAMEQEISPKT